MIQFVYLLMCIIQQLPTKPSPWTQISQILLGSISSSAWEWIQRIISSLNSVWTQIDHFMVLVDHSSQLLKFSDLS